MRSIVTKGRTVDEALESALKKLNTSREEVEVEVLDQSHGRLFGLLGKKEVSIKVTVKEKEVSEVKTRKPEITGAVGVKNGQIIYFPPAEGQKAPVLVLDPRITAQYQGKEVAGKIELSEGISSLEIQLPDSQEPFKEIRCSVSDDNMIATVLCNRFNGVSYSLKDAYPTEYLELKLETTPIPCTEITIGEIEAKLSFLGIKYGVDLTQIEKFLARTSFESVVARGEYPTEPVDARIEYIFENKPDVDLESSRIDLLEVHATVSSCSEGDLIARVVPGIPGKDGRDVFGEEISAREPRTVELKVGEGVELSEDGMEAYATVSGMPLLVKDVLKVLQVYELRGDADVSTGNIRFEGEVIIHGNVADQVKVSATKGGVRVYGTVYGAYISADNDIVINKTVVRSQVYAGGLTVVYLRVKTLLTSLEEQFVNLLQAIELIKNKSSGSDLDEETLIGSLLELKYTKLIDIAREFIEYVDSETHLRNTTIEDLSIQLADMFPRRGLFRISGISKLVLIHETMQGLIDRITQDYSNEANIKAAYLQNSSLEASGMVEITGQGCFYSNVVAGTGFRMTRGVFRGGKIVVTKGNINLQELGGPSGIVTEAEILHEGTINIGKVYTNARISINNQRYKFDNDYSAVRAYVSDGEMKVYSGSLSLN